MTLIQMELSLLHNMLLYQNQISYDVYQITFSLTQLWLSFNSLWLSDAIKEHQFCLTLVEVMACLLPDGTEPLPEPMPTYVQLDRKNKTNYIEF